MVAQGPEDGEQDALACLVEEDDIPDDDGPPPQLLLDVGIAQNGRVEAIQAFIITSCYRCFCEGSLTADVHRRSYCSRGLGGRLVSL